jgi:probable phosphoglycerate mutase
MTGDEMTSSNQLRLTARDVCQVLREVIFGRQQMSKVSTLTWDEVHGSHFVIDIDGWRITLHNDCDTLDYC